MKTQKVNSFDDILFEKRNKEYGSYCLRKKYRKIVSISMVLSFLFLGIIVAYPLINAYANKNKFLTEKGKEVGVEIRNVPREEIAPPPPPPPPPEITAERVRFTAPIVVEDSMAENNLVSMDDINQHPNTEAPGNNIEVEVPEVTAPSILEQPPAQEIFTVVEEQPSFVGGEEARIAYLQQNIKYPEEAKELGIQGKVFVTFVIEADGSITDVKVLRGIGGGCDEEAIRVVNSMPKWIPGKQRGNAVRVQFNLPIKFTLQ